MLIYPLDQAINSKIVVFKTEEQELKAIPEIEFHRYFGDCKKRWKTWLVSSGKYVEGFDIDIDE